MSFAEGKLVRQRSEPAPENPAKIHHEDEVIDSDSLDSKRTNVMFRVTNQNDERFKRSFKHGSTVSDIKKKLSKLLKTTPENLTFVKNDSTLADDIKISTLDTGTNAEVEIFTRDDSFIDVDIVKEKFNESISVIVHDEPKKKIVPAMVTCKFHVVNQSHVFTKSYPSSSYVANVKESLCPILGIDRDVLLLVKNKTVLGDTVSITELDIDAYGNLEMELFTKDGSKMRFESVYKDVPIADILTVNIAVGPNKFLDVNVEVIDARIKKPYLGGYRNKITGLEYHHAFSQTQNFRTKLPPEMKNHRDTQTYQCREIATSTVIERGTQKSEMYMPQVSDVIIVARPYRTYAAPQISEFTLNNAALCIQKSWKAYRCRRNVEEWFKQCRRRIQAIKDDELEEMRLRDLQLQKEIKATTFPRTKEDFDQLHAMVDRWRNAEIVRISKLHAKGPKVAEFCLLLDKEIQLLRSIEKFRTELSDDFRKKREENLLKEMSKPISWVNAKGKLVSMDTLETQQARKFKELYAKFCKDSFKMEERMELLVTFKQDLKDHKSKLADQLIALIDRECELLVSNFSSKDLNILRKRINTTLFQIIRNSETSRDMMKKHDDKLVKKMEDGRLYHCRQCDNVKLYNEFPLHCRTQEIRVCNRCTWNNFSDQSWVDLTPYRYILRAVRREERKNKCSTSIAFMIQVEDIYFIIVKIWHSRSAISEADDLIDLRLCRWNVAEEWSPWNCVLLTLKEMKAHIKLEDPEKVYDSQLVRKVRSNHILAKMHFKQLLHIDKFAIDE